jgi:hypothetical protein
MGDHRAAKMKGVENMNELLALANQGKTFLEQGKTDFSDQEVQAWRGRCNSTIIALYGRNNNEYDGSRYCHNVESLITLLTALGERELKKGSHPSGGLTVNVTQSNTIQNEISLQIMLLIESSDLSEPEKEEAKALYQQVEDEVKRQKPNWEKVKNLLKKSIDYGLKIAPEIVKLAAAYYSAKGK